MQSLPLFCSHSSQLVASYCCHALVGCLRKASHLIQSSIHLDTANKTPQVTIQCACFMGKHQPNVSCLATLSQQCMCTAGRNSGCIHMVPAADKQPLLCSITAGWTDHKPLEHQMLQITTGSWINSMRTSHHNTPFQVSAGPSCSLVLMPSPQQSHTTWALLLVLLLCQHLCGACPVL